jgi:hypothetical protein
MYWIKSGRAESEGRLEQWQEYLSLQAGPRAVMDCACMNVFGDLSGAKHNSRRWKRGRAVGAPHAPLLGTRRRRSTRSRRASGRRTRWCGRAGLAVHNTRPDAGQPTAAVELGSAAGSGVAAQAAAGPSHEVDGGELLRCPAPCALRDAPQERRDVFRNTARRVLEGEASVEQKVRRLPGSTRLHARPRLYPTALSTPLEAIRVDRAVCSRVRPPEGRVHGSVPNGCPVAGPLRTRAVLCPPRPRPAAGGLPRPRRPGAAHGGGRGARRAAAQGSPGTQPSAQPRPATPSHPPSFLRLACVSQGPLQTQA